MAAGSFSACNTAKVSLRARSVSVRVRTSIVLRNRGGAVLVLPSGCVLPRACEGESGCERPYKPGPVLPTRGRATISLGPGSPQASNDLPGRLEWCRSSPFLPYSIFLRVGFTLPLPSPGARCALTAPFHPCRSLARGRRSDFCGTFPGLAPGWRYQPP